MLDIDPVVRPDIVCDARKLHTLPAGAYDAVFCSHNLEHFHQHEVPLVLKGFQHVLNKSGFAHILVPDMQWLFETVVSDDRDIDDVSYVSPSGPVTFHDMIYGFGAAMAQGNLYYAHKTGFTEKSLAKTLMRARFARTYTARDGRGELVAYAFKSRPSVLQLRKLGV